MKHVQSAERLAVVIAVLAVVMFSAGVLSAGVNVAPAGWEFAADDPIVYITATGKKYHRANCGHLNKSKKAIKLSKLKRNYGPCGDCKLPI